MNPAIPHLRMCTGPNGPGTWGKFAFPEEDA
jgi:hypothetical protein